MNVKDTKLSTCQRTPRCAAFKPVTGRAPYGYRRGEHDDTALEPDPPTAPIVRRIFAEYLTGDGLQVIAERLTADGIPRPSAYDAQNNPRHNGTAWSKTAVRAIIINERYIVHQAPETRHADCGNCRQRCSCRHYAPLITTEMYRQAQDLLSRRGDTTRPGQSTARHYLLRGLLRCSLCGRRMQGNWNNKEAYYRCRFPREYAKANGIDHPANIYVREHRLVEPLQDWICRSLPVRLHDWASHQPHAVRAHLVRHVQQIRELVGEANKDQARSTRLYTALQLALVYDATMNSVRLRCEIIPGAEVLDTIAV